MSETVSAVIVSYDDPDSTRKAIASLRAQTVVPAEIVVVDNHEDALFGDGADDDVVVLRLGGNVGYTVACNGAAQRARGDWVLFLNPDATAQPDAVARLVSAGDESGAAIVGAQILLPDGPTNAGANPLHVSGMSWSGRFGEPPEDGPPREVAGVSGAALMVRRSVYQSLGGMCPEFFLYGDDADLCWRARLAGERVVFCPRAHVAHDYAFDQGNRKWFWLERNRLWSLASNYSLRALLVLAPVLFVTEVGTIVAAAGGGWWREKGAAWTHLLTRRAELRRWRAAVQATRAVGDRELVAACTAAIETPLVSNPLLRLVNPLMRGYVRVAAVLL